ncbi:MAG: hypothetical protein V4614_05380 [Pseudomonadota bacterium]
MGSERVYGSQVFSCLRGGSCAVVDRQSPQFSPELDTQCFVQAGRWMVVLHHQSHKALHGPRTSVELFPASEFFSVHDEAALLPNRLPLAAEEQMAFAVSLAYDPLTDCLAVGCNGREYQSRIYLYTGFAANTPQLRSTIDLHALGKLRPSGMAFVAGQLWVASYDSGRVSVFDNLLRQARLVSQATDFLAPIGLCGLQGRAYVSSHVGHALFALEQQGPSIRREQISTPADGLAFPWGLDAAGSDATDAAGHNTLLVANLNLDEAAQSAESWIACFEKHEGRWQSTRIDLDGRASLRGMSMLSYAIN